MSLLQIINTAVVSLGLPALLGACILIGRKLQILDRLDKIVDKEIRPDLKEVREKFFALEGKLSGMTGVHSPVSLTEKGEKMLVESGLKKFIDDDFDILFGNCTSDKCVKTAYDIQIYSLNFFEKYKFSTEMENKLKESAFNSGVSMDVVRRIAGLYFRDKCLEKLKMDKKDLDKPKTP